MASSLGSGLIASAFSKNITRGRGVCLRFFSLLNSEFRIPLKHFTDLLKNIKIKNLTINPINFLMIL